MKLTTFYVLGTFFGVNVLQVQEIYNIIPHTEVPDAPPYIKGLTNLRGQIITIFDLAQRLDIGITEITERTKTLIFKTDSEIAEYDDSENLQGIGNDRVCFLIESLGDVLNIEDNQIKPVSKKVNTNAKKYIVGEVKLDKENLLILDVIKVVNG